jgi:hypothetical protein
LKSLNIAIDHQKAFNCQNEQCLSESMELIISAEQIFFPKLCIYSIYLAHLCFSRAYFSPYVGISLQEVDNLAIGFLATLESKLLAT